MALFIFTEVMLFAGFISAYMVAEGSALPGMWPPPGQPRLPVASTLVNTVALIASGVVLHFGYRTFVRRGADAARGLLGIAVGLGVFFVAFQGVEWARLLAQGLTLTSSRTGSFFYLIVGLHALHAVAAILALGFCWTRLEVTHRSTLAAVRLFWYFVVLMWPVIYWQVYL
jgi:cytochrome c oxidase subunit 3